MMKQFLIALYIVLMASSAVAQHHTDKNSKPLEKFSRRYMTLADYKKFYKKTPDFKDTSSFMIMHGDTMIAIDNNNFKSVVFEYKDQNFLNIYKSVAFNTNNKDKDEKTRLKYWKNGIKIFFSESTSAQTQKTFKKFVNEISSGIDSLNITFVKDLDKANYVIYCKGDFEYVSHLDKTQGDYYINWNGRNQITKGFLKIDKTVYFNENLALEKMQQLFVESLGFFTTTDKLNCHSYFSKCNEKKKVFGPLDKEILKYHYSYGICKGIDTETFDNLHAKAKEHKKSNPNVPYMISHVEQ